MVQETEGHIGQDNRQGQGKSRLSLTIVTVDHWDDQFSPHLEPLNNFDDELHAV
jgi:hypothetical protein